MSARPYAAYNFVQATPRIATSGVLSPAEFVRLADEGYALVINLLPQESPYYLRGEGDLVSAVGMAYLHIPVDFAAPTLRDFESFEQSLLAAGDRKVWVHCAANYRVSVFMALFARLHLGWSAEEAADHVGKLWQPDEVWRAFALDGLASRADAPDALAASDASD